MLLKNANLSIEGHSCVRIEKGLITEIAPHLQARTHEEVIDCQGKTLLPSLIDLGVFLHRRDATTYAHLKEQAYKGGVGNLMAIPLTPLYSLKEADMEPLKLAQSEDTPLSPLEFGAMQEAIKLKDMICLHPLDSEQRLESLALLCAKLPPHIPTCLYIYNLEGQKLLPALDYARMLNLKLVCGVRGYEGRFSLGIMDQTPLSYQLGLPSVSPLIQIKEVGKYGAMALHTQLPLLLDSVVELEAFEILKGFKNLGAPIWIQTPLHHLILDETIYAHYDTRTKILPPLKPKEHQNALRELLEEGIDILTSLHYTHSPSMHIFEDAPFGMNSIDAFFPLAYTHLVKTGCISLERLLELSARNPAQFLGLDCGEVALGKQARLMLVDLEGKTRVDNPASIYHHQVLEGHVDAVISLDRIIWHG
ncbi:amidohydrolase family protein [Helicobacter felis]|uniref:amidohydrolase family protein n=1 Tax=Helicobacter felis TaxID=214 RepID=UPI000CF0F8FB|nr:amidohydrolase family protein [Helicobacter felis]